MNITIVGAGNIGLTIAGYLKSENKGNVTVFTSKNINKPVFLEEIEIQRRRQVFGINWTNSPKDAFEDTDIIFCTYPAFLRKFFIRENKFLFKSGSKIGFVPGYGGAEYECIELLNKGITIFGLQRVPYVARVEDTDCKKAAKILSKKQRLFSASIPIDRSFEISKTLQSLFDIPCVSLKEYLAVTLAPSNPLLHITGLYNLFSNYKLGDAYQERIKFYDKWDDRASRLLFKYDMEWQNICAAMQPLLLDEIVPLPVYYETLKPEDMTKKLKSIEAFKSVEAPLKESDIGYVPDLDSRMFTEDFPYGVCIIKDIALMLDMETPIIDMLLDFYKKISGHAYFNADGTYTDEIYNTGIPGNYGIRSKDDLINFYHKKYGGS